MSSESPQVLRALAFLVCGTGVATVIGIAATSVSLAGWSPVGIFSLCVGVAVGGSASALARWWRIDCRKRLLVGTLVMALAATVAQHVWLYRDYRRQWYAIREREPALALFHTESSPMPIHEYFAMEMSPERVTWWAIDATLVVAGAMGIASLLHGADRPCDTRSFNDPLPPAR